MEPVSYRFLVARDADFPAIGTLHGWRGGNASALKHLERLYPDWSQITIQKTINEATTQSGRSYRNLRGTPESQRISDSVHQVHGITAEDTRRNNIKS